MGWRIASFLALQLACLLIPCHAYDQTLQDKAYGLHVVDATTTLISNSQIFPDDYNFLQRVAFVETHFGSDPDTFTNPQFKGIWRLNEADFNETKNSNLKRFHVGLHSKFGILWKNTTWDQLNTPLYGGIAAFLFTQTFPEPIPHTKAKQAHYWHKFYTKSNHTVAFFLEEMKKLEEETPPCEAKVDLIVALDGSGSIGDAEFKRANTIVADLLDTFSNDTDFVRKGFIVFSTHNKVIFNLTSNLNATQMREKVLAVKYPQGGTNVKEAIKSAVDLFEDAPERAGVPRVLTIFTDGKSDSNLQNMAAAKKGSMLYYFTITPFIIILGGSNKTKARPTSLEYQPRIYNIENFEDVPEFFRKLHERVCMIPQEPGNDSTTDVLGKNHKRYYVYSVKEEGITVRLETKSGQIWGYYSYSYKYPSAAIHDGTLDYSTFIPYNSTALINLRAGLNNVEEKIYVCITGTAKRNRYEIEVTEGYDRTFPVIGIVFILIGIVVVLMGMGIVILIFLMRRRQIDPERESLLPKLEKSG